ncbi:hypothetical protein N7X57_13465 [Lactiplantibacillus paraplantarum]|nr:hypothetical protein [Lactiplantibacillus paraplantarum]MCW1911434.1 hypothetical protein [Lactiplantibacillus paraplantarum]
MCPTPSSYCWNAVDIDAGVVGSGDEWRQIIQKTLLLTNVLKFS